MSEVKRPYLHGLRCPFAALLLFVLAFMTGLPCRADTETWAFYRSDIPLYLAVVKQLEASLKRQFVSCPVEKTSSSFIDSHSPTVVIALGQAGLKRALTMAWTVPILALFTDEPSDDSRVVDIEISQPHQRQIELLKKLHPGLETIWYPFAGDKFKPSPALEKAVAAAGLKLTADRLQDPRALPGALRILNDRTTATVLPPDPSLMNDAIIRPVMLAAFRSQTAVVGFSEGMVRQGSAFAYVFTPEGLGAYLVDLVNGYDPHNPVQVFDNWNLILNATILDKLQLSPAAEIRNSATKVF